MVKSVWVPSIDGCIDSVCCIKERQWVWGRSSKSTSENSLCCSDTRARCTWLNSTVLLGGKAAVFGLKCTHEHRCLLFPVFFNTVAVVFSYHSQADRTVHQSLQKLATATVLLWELTVVTVLGKDTEDGITGGWGRDRGSVRGGLAASHTHLASLCRTGGKVIWGVLGRAMMIMEMREVSLWQIKQSSYYIT